MVEAYTALGARACVPVCNALDPSTHHPFPPDPQYQATLAFMGDRISDREEQVERFFFRVARALPDRTFLLGGTGRGDTRLPANVRWLERVDPRERGAFDCTPLVVLDIGGSYGAEVGWYPAPRVFEAAGAGACIITDAWRGVEDFFAPDREILVADGAADVIAHLRDLGPTRRRSIGAAARQRELRDHTWERRAIDVEEALGLEQLAEVS